MRDRQSLEIAGHRSRSVEQRRAARARRARAPPASRQCETQLAVHLRPGVPTSSTPASLWTRLRRCAHPARCPAATRRLTANTRSQPRGDTAGQARARRRDAIGTRNAAQPPPDARAPEVPVVAAEQLVAAVAGEAHRHVLPRQLRHEEGRDLRRVGERLVVDASAGAGSRRAHRPAVTYSSV